VSRAQETRVRRTKKGLYEGVDVSDEEAQTCAEAKTVARKLKKISLEKKKKGHAFLTGTEWAKKRGGA